MTKKIKKAKKLDTIRKNFPAITKLADDNSRTLVVQISTKNPDRSNDEVMPQGCDLTNYMKNPVVAAFHNYHEPPIGKTVEINITDDGIIAKVEFVPEGVNPMADMIYSLFKEGFMNAWSIGFIPTEYNYKENGAGMVINKWELLEYSAVLVPDNPEALTMLRSKGFNPDEIMAKEVADGVIVKEEEKPAEPEKPVEPITPPAPVADETVIEPVEKEVEMKEGKVLSDKHKSIITEVIKSLQVILDACETDTPKEVETAVVKDETKIDIKFLEALRDQFRTTDKEVGLALRSIKEALKNS